MRNSASVGAAKMSFCGQGRAVRGGVDILVEIGQRIDRPLRAMMLTASLAVYGLSSSGHEVVEADGVGRALDAIGLAGLGIAAAMKMLVQALLQRADAPVT